MVSWYDWSQRCSYYVKERRRLPSERKFHKTWTVCSVHAEWRPAQAFYHSVRWSEYCFPFTVKLGQGFLPKAMSELHYWKFVFNLIWNFHSFTLSNYKSSLQMLVSLPSAQRDFISCLSQWNLSREAAKASRTVVWNVIRLLQPGLGRGGGWHFRLLFAFKSFTV